MAKKVILYSSTGCPFCQKYRALFTERHLAFEERNTTDNPKYFDELAQKGILALPTVFVDGKAVSGFRPNSLLELLGA
jgi:thioredoxin reductase (NADPH)